MVIVIVTYGSVWIVTEAAFRVKRHYALIVELFKVSLNGRSGQAHRFIKVFEKPLRSIPSARVSNPLSFQLAHN